MTGLAFLLRGYGRPEQYFNAWHAQTLSMFLLLAVLSLMIPTVSKLWGRTTTEGILAQSRGTAVVIMFSYGLWLFFQLETKRAMFDEPSKKSPKTAHGRREKGDTLRGIATIGAGAGAAAVGGSINRDYLIHERDDDEEEDPPELSRLGALIAVVVFTALLALNTQFATDSIQGLMAEHGLTDSSIASSSCLSSATIQERSRSPSTTKWTWVFV